jgi:hypothetical protein
MAGRLRFKNGMPFTFKLITVIIVFNFIGEFTLLYLLPKISQPIPRGSSTYAIVRARHIYFVHPLLGHYLSIGAWLQFVLLALLVVVLVLNRSQIEKD